MFPSRAVCLLSLVATATLATAHPSGVRSTPGALLSASVEIDGETARLYPAPDGSGRFYFEALAGRRYSVVLENRSGERLGVVLTVDGLNAISGGRDEGRGRMYVLGPWQRTNVRGWRTSLEDVRAFTFVDERISYAARSGQANGKMGWIELAVYRERGVTAAPESQDRLEPAPQERHKQETESPRAPTVAGGSVGSYPGTGWGPRAHDPAMLVHFEAETQPAQTLSLRYEYRPALVALGVLPAPPEPGDRLRERERAQAGFARPPLW